MNVETPRRLMLAEMFEAFNRHDFDEVLSHLDDDVAWPNMIEMTVLHGREQVRAYWDDQLTRSIPTVTPVRFVDDGEEIVVIVDQRVAREGQVAQSTVAHRYTFNGARIAAMLVEPVESTKGAADSA